MWTEVIEEEEGQIPIQSWVLQPEKKVRVGGRG